MNTSLKKLSFALVGLAMAGAAHATTVYTVPSSPSASVVIPGFTSNGNGTTTKDYYFTVSDTGTISLDFSSILSKSDNGAGHGSNPTYLSVIYNVLNSNGTQELGSTNALTTGLGGGTVKGSISDLSLVAGTEYLLQVVLGKKTTLGGTSLSDPSVSPVPLPGTALLFGTALLGAGALRYRSKKSKAATESNPALA